MFLLGALKNSLFRRVIPVASLVLAFSGVTAIQGQSAVAAPSGVSGSIVLGTGKYLYTTDSSDFVMGSGDFTLETWVHANGQPGSNYTGFVSIGMPSDLTNGVNGHEIRIGQSFAGDGKLGFMAPNNTSDGDTWNATASALPLGRWTHLALVRSGSTLTLYVNGVSSATRTGVSFTHTGYPAKSGLGAFFISKNGGWADGEFSGAVADVRLVKGTALYTSNFTPPTSELSVIGGSNTKMLLNTNYSAANTVADYAFNAAPGGLTLTAGGSPTSSNITPYSLLDTALSLTAASSMHGYSDSSAPPLGNLANYTVEGWIKTNSACIGTGIRCEAIARDGDYDININDGKYKLVLFYNTNANTGFLDTGIAAQAGAWTHVALTRSGTDVKFYINGALAYTYTLPSALPANYSNQPFRLGYVGYSSYYYDGQIDEVKLWNTARTQAQIQSNLYAAPSDLTDTTLLAYYDCNSGFGSTLVNRKVGAAATSNLTLSGSPAWTDIKTQTTSGIDTTIKIPRSYINTAGGFELPANVTSYDYLVVGGGGGGGNGYNNGGGGGGAGGMVLTGVATNSANAIVSARVGVGGAGGASAQADNPGVAGDSSTIGSVTALGGGFGKGSRTNTNGLGGAKQISSSTAPVGGNGGGSNGGGGGGGGAGGAGGNGSGATPGSGGAGLAVTIGSVTATYGAGAAGAQGATATVGVWASLNTGNGGSGGGAGASANNAGGSGGTGMIIIHYALGSTLTYSYSSGQPVYRIQGTITATALTSGKVNFYERGKIIPGCRNRPTDGSNVATCAWKPATHGAVTVTMSLIASSGATANTSTTANFVVNRRATFR